MANKWFLNNATITPASQTENDDLFPPTYYNGSPSPSQLCWRALQGNSGSIYEWCGSAWINKWKVRFQHLPLVTWQMMPTELHFRLNAICPKVLKVAVQLKDIFLSDDTALVLHSWPSASMHDFALLCTALLYFSIVFNYYFGNFCFRFLGREQQCKTAIIIVATMSIPSFQGACFQLTPASSNVLRANSQILTPLT